MRCTVNSPDATLLPQVEEEIGRRVAEERLRLAQAAGLHASRLDGSKLAYNQADPFLPDILICPAGLADVLLDGLRVAGCSATQ